MRSGRHSHAADVSWVCAHCQRECMSTPHWRSLKTTLWGFVSIDCIFFGFFYGYYTRVRTVECFWLQTPGWDEGSAVWFPKGEKEDCRRRWVFYSEHVMVNRFPAPSSKLCQIWLHHWRDTLYLRAAVLWRGQRPPRGSAINKTVETT